MSFPGYPDSFDPGWWDEVCTTPPIFTGTGTLTNGSVSVSSFNATFQMMTIPPIVGMQVSGTGIPTNTVIATVTDASDFTMSAAATSNGTGVSIQVGAEPVSLAEAKSWARVEFNDDDILIQDIIRAAREWAESVAIKRAMMLQGRTYYAMGFPWSGGYYNRLIRSMGPNPWWLPTAQGIIMLPYPNLQQLISIKYIDPSSGTLLTIPQSQTLQSRGQVPSRIMPVYGATWPLPQPVINSVQITYSAGYGPFSSDIPAPTRLAMRSMIAANYENREAYLDSGQLQITGMAQRFMDVENWGGYW